MKDMPRINPPGGRELWWSCLWLKSIFLYWVKKKSKLRWEKKEIRPEASGSKREREKVEEASVTDILQNALMQKTKTEQEPEKRLRLLSGLPIKWRFRIISPEVVMPVDPLWRWLYCSLFCKRLSCICRYAGGKNAGTDFCPPGAIYFFLWRGIAGGGQLEKSRIQS